jgi:thioredoxin reductase
VIEGMNSDGALMATTEVENFPGHRDRITGPARLRSNKATALDRSLLIAEELATTKAKLLA